jgi:hypothetical protein
MTQFIMWPKTIDAAFRTAYLTETGENIQSVPLESSDGLSYMVGSDRATQAQIDNLKGTYTELKTGPDTPPVEWVPQTE